MNRQLIFLVAILLLFISVVVCHAQNKTLTYPEVIQKYKTLDSLYEDARMIPYGKTDCGESLHLFIISHTRIFDPTRIHELNKCMLMIINEIHPGEPDGIDASIQLATDLLSKPLYSRLLENVVVCIVPVFNIDGSLERGCCSRVNQDGPEEYGSRSNSKNLDLNRDFMKAETRNTLSLINIIRKWNPDVAIDTHVSDGADYQYTMTLIASQHNKMNRIAGNFMNDVLTPALFDKMKEKNDEMIPYVNIRNESDIPDSGIIAFLETPRFLSGYMALFNNFPFISESHMLKPFDKRVKSTLNILTSIVEVCDENKDAIIDTRNKANDLDSKSKYFCYNWDVDTLKKESIAFKGYKASYKPSEITGKDRLWYDRSKPYEKKIPYFNSYYAKDSVLIPKYFLIPQAYENVVRLLEINGATIIRNTRDSTSTVTVNYIDKYETVKNPYEGHYLHYDVKTRSEKQQIKFRAGDYLIPLPQKSMRYILEALIPEAGDSYFCWGFFDSFLQQKEGFSSYVFEDVAEKVLQKNPTLKSNFEEWKKQYPSVDEYTKLNYIYQRSEYFEKAYMRYPIFLVY